MNGGEDTGHWEHAVKLGNQKTGVDFKARIAGLKPWTQYYYRCQVINKRGTAWGASSIPFFTRGVLPEGWDSTFVGYGQRPGNGANLSHGILTVRGSGRDIGEPGEAIDNFQYAYARAGPHTEIQGRLEGMEGNTRVPLAGVMLRENLDAGSKSVSLLHDKNGLRLFGRVDADLNTTISKAVAVQVPVYLKLIRDGDSFSGHFSTDGMEWTQIGAPVTIKMATTITCGLAVTAGNRDASRNQDAKFDHVDLK